MTRIVDRYRRISLRQRFLVAPLLGLLLLGLLTAAFTYESQRQNALLTRIVEGDLAEFERDAAVFIELSAEHMGLYDLLTRAGKMEEDALYLRAKARLNAIYDSTRKLEAALPMAKAGTRDGNPGLGAKAREILAFTQAYRRAATSAVEMTTVNPALAPREIAYANDQFVAMNRVFEKLLDAQLDKVTSDVSARVERNRSGTILIALAGIFFAALLVILSIVLSRLLSHSLEAQIGILAQLGDRTGVDAKVEGVDEVERIGRAIAAFRNTQLELRESEERYRQVVELSPDGILVQSENKVAYVNSACIKMFGAATADELVDKPVLDFIHPDNREDVEERIQSLPKEGGPAPMLERKAFRIDGTAINVEATAAAFVYRGKPAVLVVLRDITQRKKSEEQLAYLAHYDSLTGLPNRNLFRDRLSLAVARAKRSGQMFALMHLDLDRFKEINDSLGHPAGDLVLQAVAELLKKSTRGLDTVARPAGDEFAIIVEGMTHADQVTTVAEKIKHVFDDPIVLEGREILVTASIGIAVFPRDTDDVNTLLQAANLAMSRAKAEGRNAYEFYAPAMDRTVGRLDMSVLLRRALKRQEFVLHYQPKVDIASGQIVGVEALIRWNSRDLGFVPPGRFIPLAEETGLIVPISEWVLKEACAQNKAWQDRGFPPLLMSVNLSPRQFRQKDLVETISGILQEAGLEPRFLELEITEGTIMHQADKAVALLEQLHQLGVQLSVDDFGTGYSSLAYLKRFPVQTLKIDQSFVRDLTTDADGAGIVEAVIAMAKSLKLSVIAEGVETKEQLASLAKLECDEYQGYYFSKPVPAEDFARLLKQTTSIAAA
jgi:diguanylate cyclase (GGDEF)-like protein/PAS domain S-box-containing protein